MIKLSKILAVKVIILLIIISGISSADDVNINNDEELIENPEVEQLDDEIEIISYIGGIAFDVNKTGSIFNKPITITPWKSAIFIFGIKLPSFMFFYYHPNCVIKVSRFFGTVKQEAQCQFDVQGIAIGNIVHIEW